MRRLIPLLSPAAVTSRPESLLLVFSLGFGILFLFLAPPFHAPDEPAHFFRAWALSEGRIRAEKAGGIQGVWIPVSLLRTTELFFAPTTRQLRPVSRSTLAAALAIPINPKERIFLPAPGSSRRQRLAYAASGYTPAGYVGSAPGVLVARWLGAPPLIALYAGRLANLLLATLLAWFAVLRAPFLQWAFAWVLLLPMVVHLRAAISTDALLISLAFLTVAEILRGLNGPDRISPRILLVAAGWLCLVKQGYGLIPLIALALPAKAFSSGLRRVVLLGSLVLVVVVGSAGSMLFPRDMKTPIPPQEVAERTARTAAVQEAPSEFLRSAGWYWLDFGPAHAREFVGNLGWLDTPVPTLAAVGTLWILVLLTQLDGIALGHWRLRAWAVLLFIATATVMTVHVHVGSQPSRFIDGIQGRYFLPLAPLPLVAMGWRLPSLSRVARPGIAVASLSFILLALAGFLLLQRHWI